MSFSAVHAGIELRRLGAVAAVFRTAACFHGQQRGQFDVALGPMCAVRGLRAPEQFHEWKIEELLYRLNAPTLPSLRRNTLGNARMKLQCLGCMRGCRG